MKHLHLAAALLVLAAPAAFAGDKVPYPERLDVSPLGRHYVIIRGELGEKPAGSFEIVRRREGAPVLASVRVHLGGVEAARHPGATPLKRAPEDVLLASGVASQLPQEVRVLDSAPAAIFYDNFRQPGEGVVLALLDHDGSMRWQLRLGDLFREEEIGSLSREGGHANWCRAWWVDEDRGAVIVFDGNRVLREVRLADGSVGRAPPVAILARIATGPAEERVRALDVALETAPEGLTARARAVAENPQEALALRLRAALALKRSGAKVDLVGIFVEAMDKKQPGEVRQFAMTHLREIQGRDSLPVLLAVMRSASSEQPEDLYGAMEGLTGLGDLAVPGLVELLRDTRATPEGRGGAAHVLKTLKNRTSLPALWEAVADSNDYVAAAAVNATIAIGDPALNTRLLDLLKKGTTQDARIATFFEEHPQAEAIEPLVLALERSKPDTTTRDLILDAIKRVSGKDFGTNPEQWRKGLLGK